MSTAVVIPTFNRRETVLAALQNLFASIPPEILVIVVDSGSSDGTADAVKRLFPQVLFIQGSDSMWWAAATNLGVQKARDLGCSHVITYNDDNIATPGLFAALAEASQSFPNSLVSAVCCYLDRPDLVFFAGRMRANNTDRFYYLDHNVPVASLNRGNRVVDLLHGMCTLIPMSVFHTIGLFDERAFPYLFADDDFALRAAEAGFELRVSLDARVLNDRTLTGVNPYGCRVGPVGIFQLLFSRRSTFQISTRTRFLWRHRRSVYYFLKTCIYDYLRLPTLILARWFLPTSTFEWLGRKWALQHNRR